MVLVIAEKNDAAKQIARLLSQSGKPKQDKVYDTPVYRFRRDGDDWVAIGLRGHILAPDFPTQLTYDKSSGWFAVDTEGEVLSAQIPASLPKPPFDGGLRKDGKPKKPKKPFMEDGVDIKGWKLPSLPYLIWAPVEKNPAEKGIIRALKNLAKKASAVIIATDFDREGELIGSDALNQVRQANPDIPATRARYSAYTKAEIDHAFNNLVELDQNLADAGESRQYIDLIWGAALTRYLTMARFGGFGNVRSAGRVQTPTLALVVERERERQAFVPEDYWVIGGRAAKDGESFKISHATGRFTNGDAAQEAFDQVRGATTGQVTAVTKKSRKSAPPAPFNTTSMQAAAAAEGIAPGRAMRLAESLYMDGLISYPRVDNTVYPASLDLAGTLKALRKVPAYAPICDQILAGPLHATRGKQETTDHPPIYPTAPADPEKLEPAAWKLYNLIARRFMATLMGPAVIEGTKVSVDVAGQPFSAAGDVLKEKGYRAAYPYGLKKDEQLPSLAQGDTVEVSDLALEAKQTEPPARYSQGRLIQEMEKRGLGTKSTRASIIDRLFQVKYLKNNPVEPSQLGMAIIDALDSYAPTITTPSMTSELEQDMNLVAEGSTTEDAVVDHSRALLAGMMDQLIEHTEDLGEAIADAVTADARVGACPKCGKDLVIKNSPKTQSRFIGCMGWPDCDVTYPVPGKNSDKIEPLEEPCPECGAPRLKIWPFRSKPYEQCVNPQCPTNQEPDVIVGTCPVCAEAGRHGDLVAHKSEKTGKRFIRCTNYDECGVSYPLPQRGALHALGTTCPECGAPEVEIETERGPWKICVNMNCPAKEKKKAASPRRGGRRAKAK